MLDTNPKIIRADAARLIAFKVQEEFEKATFRAYQEQKKLIKETLEGKIESLCETIARLAAAGKVRCNIINEHHLDDDLWVAGARDNSLEYLAAIEKLRSLGYGVYSQTGENCKVFTLIEWW